MTKAAFQAVYVNFKTVPSRKVCQIVLEVAMENGDDVIKALGMPNPEQSKWVAVAVLDLAKAQKTEPVDAGGLASASGPGDAQDGQATPGATPRERARPAATPQDARVRRAGWRCNEAQFQGFLKNDFPNEWRQAELMSEGPADTAAVVLREVCQITSRRELAHNIKAAEIFDRIEGQYQMYIQHPTTRGNYDNVATR